MPLPGGLEDAVVFWQAWPLEEAANRATRAAALRIDLLKGAMAEEKSKGNLMFSRLCTALIGLAC